MMSHGGAQDKDRLEAIRDLLDEGLSWGAIGRQLRVTKNVVAGLVRRHLYDPDHVPQKRGKRDPAKRSHTKRERPKPVPVVIEPPPQPPPPPVPVPSSCQWPTSNGRPWRFCDAPAVAGWPYCAAHCRAGYHGWQAAA